MPYTPRTFAIGKFQSILPPVRLTQEQSLDWLRAAHSYSRPETTARLSKLIDRVACKADRISQRYSIVPDFLHTDFSKMAIYSLNQNSRGAPTSLRTSFYQEAATQAFQRLYSEESRPPSALLHVSCTGYDSPSGAERRVSKLGWGHQTEVHHLYHMGCYAAIPALRIAAGLDCQRVDIVHTEFCSLHLNPEDHSPEQLVIQSLFSDGIIQYSLEPLQQNSHGMDAGLELLRTRKEVIPASEDAMTWRVGDYGMEMTLSRDVPSIIAENLTTFLDRLSTWNEDSFFAIHPGGPRILDQIQELLGLNDRQLEKSRKILRQHGNMSSATLPHIWKELLEDPAIPNGAQILSLAFGPGLSFCGNVLRKRLL